MGCWTRTCSTSTKRGRLFREVGRLNDDRANFEALLRNWTDLESHIFRTSEGQQFVHELRNEMMPVQESAVKPDLTQDLVIRDLRSGMNRQEATIES